jgi:hypothetical protein
MKRQTYSFEKMLMMLIEEIRRGKTLRLSSLIIQFRQVVFVAIHTHILSKQAGNQTILIGPITRRIHINVV